MQTLLYGDKTLKLWISSFITWKQPIYQLSKTCKTHYFCG